MTSEEFVRRIRLAVYEPAIEGCLSLLEKPPGRRPAESIVALSQWYNQLPPDDKERVRATIQMGVGKAVFGMLTVLDGVRAIREAGEETGTLELRYITGGRSILINDPTGEFLHDLFNEQVPPA
jgi:hypothetical protein